MEYLRAIKGSARGGANIAKHPEPRTEKLIESTEQCFVFANRSEKYPHSYLLGI
jgi:hypothetical protein